MVGSLAGDKRLDVYWEFAAKRQDIFWKRMNGKIWWTVDSIFSAYKFTNVYRAADRTSQYLIRNVIYRGDQSPEELFFRIILFKFFNKIETWEMVCAEFGGIPTPGLEITHLDRLLLNHKKGGGKLYSGAYTPPSGGRVSGVKHTRMLKVLYQMMQESVPLQISEAYSLGEVYEILSRYTFFGPFIAFQIAVDLNYSTLVDFDEMDFVVPGPGCKDGVKRTLGQEYVRKSREVVQWMAENQEQEFRFRGLEFRNLWGRALKLIDCQNIFCEISKYVRLRDGTAKGRTRRKFIPDRRSINYWFPPKWGLNEKIIQEQICHI